MADNLQNIQNLQRTVGQTWGQAFENVDKTSEAFHRLVDEFVNFVGDWKEFSDLRRDRMADYIEDLGDVQGNWEKINRWVSDNSDTLDTYVGSLTDIRNLFQSIATETGGLRRQTQDRVNLTRNLARLANDSVVALKQEGGLTDRVVMSLRKKGDSLAAQYDLQLQILGIKNPFDETALAARQEVESQKLEAVSERIKTLEDLRSKGLRLTAEERAQLRILKEQAAGYQVNVELLDKQNRLAVKGLQDQLKEQEKLFRIQRRGGPEAGPNATGANEVKIASKVLGKTGLSEQAAELQREYGEWVSRRVEAEQNLNTAKLAAQEAKQSLEAYQKDWLDKQGKSRIVQQENDLDLRVQQTRKAGLQSSFDAEFKEDKLGRLHYRQGGKFVTPEDQKRAAELLREIRDVDRYIKDIEGRIKQAGEESERARKTWERQVDISQKAQERLNEAAKEEGEVFKQPFDLTGKIKDYIVEGYLHLGKWGGPLGVAVILVTAFWHHLLKIDEEAVKTKRVIGQWADASALANTKFVSGTEVLKTMRDLGEQFHINPVQVFSSEELGRIAQAQKLTGMTAQAAGNLAVQSKITGKNADTYRDSIAKGANQANKLNHSAVNLSAVQNDVLNTSRAITLSYGKNTEGLARAAGAAAALGTNLQGVENIAKNLMNFESSIESEMQAQLLTGQQLNLAKAREYALNNDLEGVAREVGRQGVDAARFSHMNYIQQENMAKALGMSREEMSKMLIMQEINNGLSAKQVAAMTGMKRQDIEALSAQEKWQTMKQRFLESLVPLLEPILQLTTDILIPVTRFVLGPITWLAGLISRIGNLVKEDNVVVRGLVGILAIAIPAALLRGVGLVGGLGKAFKGLATLGVKIGKSIGGWATGLTRAGKSAQATGAIFDKTANRWRDVKTGRFTKAPVAATKNVTKAATTVAPAAEGASKTGKIFSSLGNNVAKLALGAVAIGIMVAALWGFAKACQEFQKVDWVGGLLKASAALVLLGGIAALAGLVAPQILLGGIALGAAAAIFAGSIALLAGALGNLTKVSGEELTGTATGIRAIAGAVGELAVKLGDLSVRKLNALGRAFRKLRGASIQVATPVQNAEAAVTQVSRTQEEPRESARNPRENIEAAVQEITIKQAQVQASAQQISIEQKATDLSKIEKKLDNVISAIVNSKPDWDWLEFKREFATNM